MNKNRDLGGSCWLTFSPCLAQRLGWHHPQVVLWALQIYHGTLVPILIHMNTHLNTHDFCEKKSQSQQPSKHWVPLHEAFAHTCCKHPPLSPYPSMHWAVFPIRKFPWTPRQTRIPICICMTLKPEVWAQESCLSQTFLNPPAPGTLPEWLCKEFIPSQTPSNKFRPWSKRQKDPMV